MTTITAGKKRFTDYEVRMRVSTITLFASHKRHTDAEFVFILSHMKYDDVVLFSFFDEKIIIIIFTYTYRLVVVN